MRARARIVAEGDVQKAGYRDIVEDIAVKLGVKGFVENLRDKTVCVVCEGEKDVVDRFVD
ncbi:MAG: acylphosphatase, partial [Candidatus Thermoplasmatota archaeon]|nr:acylphosphatase [Candidatus Thermoplasmatota archaeon]